MEPDNRAEVAVSRAESMRQFRLGVKRDLEWLLNTTLRADRYSRVVR